MNIYVDKLVAENKLRILQHKSIMSEELAGNGEVEEILEEAYRKNVCEIEQRDMDHVESYGVEFCLPRNEVMTYGKQKDNFEDFRSYASKLNGEKTAELRLTAEERDGKQTEVAQSVRIDVNIPENHLVEFYNGLNQEFEVDRAGVTYMGLGKEPVEAYEDASFMVSFLGTRGKDAIYLNIDCSSGILESDGVETDNPDDLKLIYGIMEDRAVYFEDPVLMGEEEEEWMVCDRGYLNTRELC